MDETKILAEQFEAHRGPPAGRRLPDARLARPRPTTPCRRRGCGSAAPTPSEVENLGGWLTTVVGRVCLDMLRSGTTRREEPLGRARARSGRRPPATASTRSSEALLADSVGPGAARRARDAAPAERLAFVLHDMFAVPFDEIAPIVDRSPAATRQLASRARRRVQGRRPLPDADLARQRAGGRRVPRRGARRRLRRAAGGARSRRRAARRRRRRRARRWCARARRRWPARR